MLKTRKIIITFEFKSPVDKAEFENDLGTALDSYNCPTLDKIKSFGD